MDWIRENKTLATIVGVFLAASAGIGVLVFNAYSAYGETRDRFGAINNALALMKSAPLFPSAENEERKRKAVEGYESEVNRLSAVLLALQPPVEEVTETDFQAKLKARIEEVRGQAGQTTKLPANFALGFGEYTASLPRSREVATELMDYMNASDAVVRAVIEAGVGSVDTFERSELVSESGRQDTAPQARPGPGAGAAPAGVGKEVAKMVERRTITMTLTSDQAPLQNLLNTLASPSKMPHFTAVRLLRVENEKNEGPLRAAVQQQLNRQRAPTEVDESGESVEVIIGADGQPAAAVEAAPEVLAPAKPGREDAVSVLGQEKLKVYLEIDIIKFIKGAEEAQG
jgi:hypothetical protein